MSTPRLIALCVSRACFLANPLRQSQLSKRHITVGVWTPKPGLSSSAAAAPVSTQVQRTNNADAIEEYPSTATEVQESFQELPDAVLASNGSRNSPSTAQFNDEVEQPLKDSLETDWSTSFSGLSTQAFSKEVADVLLSSVDTMDIEIKPDGLIYLPEIKYRRVLNRAFGPGGWGLAPRSATHVGPRIVSREYALVCHGRLVAIARGEQEYFDPSGVATATEACKSNALMRCCKDLGVASELWDPRFIREFKAKHCLEIFAEHVPTKKKKKLWRRKDQPKFDYPYKEKE